MANQIDYFTVEIPDSVPPEEYHYTQRRAELLTFILRAGSPTAINQTRLAGRYGVTQGQISQDIDKLGDCVAESLGSRAKLQTQAMFERVTTELLQADDWRAKKAAWDVITDWNDWLGEIGAQEREPTRSEVDVDMDVRERRSEIAFHVIEDWPSASPPVEFAEEPPSDE